MVRTLADLLRNPVKVSFTPFEIPESERDPHFSNNAVYCLGDDGLNCYNSNLKKVNNGRNNNGTGKFIFFCGSGEIGDGRCCMSDYDGRCYEKLEALFSDFGDHIEVGAAENCHEVILFKGISAEEIWKVVETRLQRSGAVKLED